MPNTSISVFSVIVFIAFGLPNVQPTNVIEIISEEEQPVGAGAEQDATGRALGNRIFDALAFKESMLHNKISFLFSLIRPGPYFSPFGAGAVPPYPIQPGVVPPGIPAAIPPGISYPGAYPPGYPIRPGVVYPGINPYNPYQPGFVPPGVLPVVAETNENSLTGAGGGGGGASGQKPSAPVVAATTTTPPPAAEESEPSEPSEEEVKRQKTIKMMPKSFKMN